MKLRSTAKFKRDGQHATPQDSPESDTLEESKSAPTARDLRHRQRRLRLSLRADDEAQASSLDKWITNDPATAKHDELDEKHNEETNHHAMTEKILSDYKKRTRPLGRDKTQPPDIQPENPHSGHRASPDDQPPPLGGGPNTEPCSNRHAARESNLSCLERQQNQKIDYPPAKDPRWKETDTALTTIIPQMVKPHQFRRLSVTELSEKFHDRLYAELTELFGTIDPSTESPSVRREPRPHKGLVKLRARKRKLKKQLRALKKAGLARSVGMTDLKRRWRLAMRQHNALRVALQKKKRERSKRAAEIDFKKNPNKFANKLFHGPGQSAIPTFSKEECVEYFAKTYRDKERDHSYVALNGMIRPGLPKEAFVMRPPTVKQLMRSVKRKRNGACPGLDAISYLPFKRCPSIILLFLHKLAIKIWKLCAVADDWAQAFIVLLKKGSLIEDLEIVSEFRPIAMTACMGKILLTILSDRLQRFLVKNTYIPRQVQKGFLSGVAGCVEHSFMLFEALKEAKEEQRQIVVSWIDLANAYGSVRHNLIQFALNWYHVPQPVQDMIFNYYNKLMAKIVTKEWSSDFFLFDIGLFQGCVLSSILFLCVFQLLLDFLQPLREKHGYSFKRINVKSIAEAYADDLALETKNAVGNQIVCDAADEWLQWTATMKAKPRKCVALGFKQFDPRTKSENFTPVFPGKKFSPYDPKLTIAGKRMHFILDPAKGGFKGEHFKFLGRWIHFFLLEKGIKDKTEKALIQDIDTVNKSRINGLMKLWIYQFYLVTRLSWVFLIHDLDLSFSKRLQTIVQPFLKKWSGIGRSVDEGMLYRTRENLGLQLTSLSDHFVSMQLVKAQLLQESVDPNVRTMWKAKTEREATIKKRFRISKLNTVVNAQVKVDLMAPTQVGRQCLGAGKFNNQPTVKEKRKLASITCRSFAEDKRVQHAQSLAQQGTWIRWHDKITPFDLSWQNLIYGPGPYIIKFVLNATVNWVKTPDLMRKFGYKGNANCPLCRGHCTTHHIISNCSWALKGKRYTWRHDSVLLYLQPVLQQLIDEAAASSTKQSIVPIQASFVKAGSTTKVPKRTSRRQTLLDGATDWRLLVEIGEKIVFPPEILATPLRPDIIIWSKKEKRVILIELTVPAEEGIFAAQIRKEARYFALRTAIKKTTSWSCTLLTIEVGARGFVARTLPRCLKKLGLKPRKTSRVCKDLSDLVSRCTYAIYLARESKAWDKDRPLLTIDDASKAPRQPDIDVPKE